MLIQNERNTSEYFVDRTEFLEVLFGIDAASPR